MEVKLEEWQAVTIEALVERRSRVAQRAKKTVDGINATLKRYIEDWGDGEGPFEFEKRGDEMYLVVRDEAELAPTD